MFKLLSSFSKCHMYSLKEDIQQIYLPLFFEEMTDEKLKKEVEKTIYKKFKKLNLKRKNLKELHKLLWSQWDMCLLMSLLKRKISLKKDYMSNYCHKDTSKLDEESLEIKLNTIILGFNRKDLNKDHVELMKEDFYWSSFQVSIVLHYIEDYLE